MGNIGRWIGGAIGGAIGLFGLFFAANATDAGPYYAGLVIFLVGVIFIFYQLKRGLDQWEADLHAQQRGASKSTAKAASTASAKSGSTSGGGKAKSGSSKKSGGQAKSKA